MDNDKKSEEVKYIASSLRKLNLLSEQFEKGLLSLSVTDDVLQELLSEIPEQLDRIERAILALSSPEAPGMSQITDELRQEILAGHIESIKKQIKQQFVNRSSLQEESASYAGNVPLHITNQILKITTEIDRLESELQHFKGLLK